MELLWDTHLLLLKLFQLLVQKQVHLSEGLLFFCQLPRARQSLRESAHKLDRLVGATKLGGEGVGWRDWWRSAWHIASGPATRAEAIRKAA